MIELYSAEVCPFAQRVRAVLTHLEVPFRTHEIDLAERDPEFLAKTPTGKVPLLVDGKLTLYESAVICGYLAERHEWGDAFAEDVEVRARQRLAMVTWDETIAPAFYTSLRDGALESERKQALVAELKELAKTVHATRGGIGDLLSFHVATFWARMCWLHDASPVPGIVGEWVDVKRWLDAAVAQPAIQATLPDKDATIAGYREKFVGTGPTS